MLMLMFLMIINEKIECKYFKLSKYLIECNIWTLKKQKSQKQMFGGNIQVLPGGNVHCLLNLLNEAINLNRDARHGLLYMKYKNNFWFGTLYGAYATLILFF